VAGWPWPGERPDAIFAGLQVPGDRTAARRCVRLRADAELRSTPVIMLTAESSRAAVVKIAKLGVRD